MNSTIDLSLQKNQDYALYVPALSSSYCHWASMWEDKVNQLDKNGQKKFGNRQPKGLSKNARELYFLDKNNGCFHYNAALYSAGHAEIFDLPQSQKNEALVHTRDKNTTIIADSGGFQIATCAMGSSVSKFDWKNPKGKQSDDVRLAILRWMESIADYSMMLDVPTYTIQNPKSPIQSFQECIDLTKYNADFFIKHRTPGATKILNTLHGRTKDESDIWWNVFKDYPFEGWAIGGVVKHNMELFLRRLLIMRDGGYLGKDQKWLHVLGASRLSTSCVLTEIQRAIRKTINEDFTISYDSASPFVVASKGHVYTQNAFEGGKKNPRFSYVTHKMIECLEAVGSDKPFPFASAPGRLLTLGDICVRDPAITGTATTWDSFSYVLLMWHNLYRQIDAIQEALRIYDMPSKQVISFIPSDILEFKDLCPEIFTSEKPFDLIEKHRKMLHKITGVNGDTHVPILDNVTSNLFTWDNTAAEVHTDKDYETYDDSEGRESEIIDLDTQSS